MTQNIEQRTLAAVNQYENASGIIDKFAHADEVLNTPTGAVKTFPKISKEWDENSKALTADWKAERDALSIKALPVLPWANGETETNINQQRRFTDGHTYLPKSVPALMNAEPDNNWIAYTADKSDVLSDVFGTKPADLVNDLVITPINNQYPKLAAFGAIYELADNSVSYTVKSFKQSVGGDCVITLSDDSLLIAKKVDAASKNWILQEAKINALHGIVARTLSNRFAEVVNVLDKGAVADYERGDGTSVGVGTDNSVALKKTIDWIRSQVHKDPLGLLRPQAGYKVVFPFGDYKLDGSWDLSHLSNVILDMSGASIVYTGNQMAFDLRQSSYLSFINPHILLTQDVATACGMFFEGTRWCSFENPIFSGMRTLSDTPKNNKAVYFHGGPSDTNDNLYNKFKNPIFRNIGWSVEMYSEDSVYTRNNANEFVNSMFQSWHGIKLIGTSGNTFHGSMECQGSQFHLKTNEHGIHSAFNKFEFTWWEVTNVNITIEDGCYRNEFTNFYDNNDNFPDENVLGKYQSVKSNNLHQYVNRSSNRYAFTRNGTFVISRADSAYTPPVGLSFAVEGNTELGGYGGDYKHTINLGTNKDLLIRKASGVCSVRTEDYRGGFAVNEGELERTRISYNPSTVETWISADQQKNQTATSYNLAISYKSVHAGTTNQATLGTATNKWKEIFCGNGTINTSDIRLKQDIAEIDVTEIRIAKKLKALLRKFRWKDAVLEKGDKARIHFGIMAQDVIEAFRSEGLNAHNYGLLTYDKWDDEYIDVENAIEISPEIPAQLNDKGEEITKKVEAVYEIKKERLLMKKAGEVYGVRYTELLAFIIAAM